MSDGINDLILVIIEPDSEEVTPVVRELVVAAQKIRQLSSRPGLEIVTVVAGEAPKSMTKAVSEKIGGRILALQWPDEVTIEALQQGLKQLVNDISPAFVILPHTTMGREIGPYLGAKLEACAISGVTAIQRCEERLVFFRPVLDNTRLLPLCPPMDMMCVLTVFPGMFNGEIEKAVEFRGEIEHKLIPKSWLSLKVKRLNMTGLPTDNRGIMDAKIVVAAGRGIGSAEKLAQIENFANRFSGACLGASRPLVDMDWVPHGRQVGITGATIAPDLYIACGISGSSQHLAGMAGSKWVVSINTNPDAPICGHADLSIVADLNSFIDAFVESLS